MQMIKAENSSEVGVPTSGAAVVSPAVKTPAQSKPRKYLLKIISYLSNGQTFFFQHIMR